MTLQEVRNTFLNYYKERGHSIIPSSPLVPENDPTTLFTGSGMQALLPYLLGQKHPQGTRITDSQKAFRSGDIEDVGDNRHTTFFEMLGNWSLGDYFKKEQIPWVFGFLVDELKLNPEKIFVTAFMGDEKNNIPKDTEVVELWQKLFSEKGIEAKVVELVSEENAGEVGMGGGRIFYYNSKKNWWSRSGVPEKMPVGEIGGGDSEMFYDFGTEHDKKFGKHCHPNCDCGRFIEIGNSVFMEYIKTEKGFEKLPQQNVDFGGGLERLVMATIGKNDIFEIDVLKGIIQKIEEISGATYSLTSPFLKDFRIIADHMRASIFLIGDGVLPANSDQGYFVRRLLRRSVRAGFKMNTKESLSVLVDLVALYYKEQYPTIFDKKEFIKNEIIKEEEKFKKTLKDGLKEFEKRSEDFKTLNEINLGSFVFFDLYTTYGFPVEQSLEEYERIIGSQIPHDTKERIIESFKTRLIQHQELSRAGSEQKFKGGLGGTGEIETKYHTATHLLHQALREVLGETVQQKGSNITSERLRFDFSFGRKMTDEEKNKVEEIINKKIGEALPVNRIELPKDEAEKSGALHFFGDTYPDIVSVYYIGDSLENAYSKEFCGGPHIKNTSEIGRIKIQKEEAVSAGVRRIKIVLV